jgi:hypothetical protein
LSETKNNIQKLRGTYGFKRFSRDGFNCSLEDPSQRYYKEGKTKVPNYCGKLIRAQNNEMELIL